MKTFPSTIFIISLILSSPSLHTLDKVSMHLTSLSPFNQTLQGYIAIPPLFWSLCSYIELIQPSWAAMQKLVQLFAKTDIGSIIMCCQLGTHLYTGFQWLSSTTTIHWHEHNKSKVGLIWDNKCVLHLSGCYVHVGNPIDPIWIKTIFLNNWDCVLFIWC